MSTGSYRSENVVSELSPDNVEALSSRNLAEVATDVLSDLEGRHSTTSLYKEFSEYADRNDLDGVDEQDVASYLRGMEEAGEDIEFSLEGGQGTWYIPSWDKTEWRQVTSRLAGKAEIARNNL